VHHGAIEQEVYSVKWQEVGGWIGTVLIVLAYALISNGVVTMGFAYQGMNLVGAALLGVNVLQKKAWASFTLQIVWIGISLFALAKMI
jgi:hypothetical protein